MLLIEKRRVGITARLQRLSLPHKRYADLCLAAALCRSERRCLAGVEEPESPVNRCLGANLDAQLAELEESLARVERWLPSGARVAAEADARSRFLEIADRIRRELGSEELEPRMTARRPEPNAPPATRSRCTATTLKGTRCKNRAGKRGLCAIHVAAQARAQGTATAPTPAAPEPEPEREPAESEEPNSGFEPPRIARFAWPVAATATLTAAGALILSGLSGGGQPSLGPGLTIGSAPDPSPLPIIHSSFGDAQGDARADEAAARREGSRRSHASAQASGAGDTAGRGDPSIDHPSILASAGSPAGADGADGARGSSPAPGVAAAPPDPAPTPEPSPPPSPTPSGGGNAPPVTPPQPSEPAGLGDVVEDVIDRLPLASSATDNLPPL